MKKIYKLFLVFFLLLTQANLMAQIRVIYYKDFSFGTDQMATALAGMGSNYTVYRATSDADFATRIAAPIAPATERYDLAIFFVQDYYSNQYTSAINAMGAFMNRGGRVIYVDWSRNSTAYTNEFLDLSSQFGATFTGNGNQTQVTVTDPTLASGLASNPFTLTNPGWGIISAGLLPVNGSTVLATFGNGEAAIVINRAGTALVLGFLNDVVPAGLASIFTNSILLATPGFCATTTFSENIPTPTVFANRTNYLVGDNAAISSVGCSKRVVWSNGIKAGAFLLQDLKEGTYTFSSYCLDPTNCNRSNQSNTVTITVSTKVSAPAISATKTIACVAETINLSATGCEGGTVKWSNNQSGPSIAYLVMADATITAKCEKNGQLSDNSNPLPIFVKQSLVITASKNTICAGETVNLSSTGCMGTTFWNINNKFKMGAFVTITPDQTSTYTATCDVSGDCGASVPAKKTITVLEAISVSVASNATGNAPILVGNTLSLSAKPNGMTAYRWSGPANFVSSLQNPSIQNMQSQNMGFYNLQVMNDACEAMGQIFVQVLSSSRLGASEESSNIVLNAYPNPSADVLNVEVDLPYASPLKIQLLDITGRNMAEWNIEESAKNHKKQLNISTLNQGMFLLLVESNEGQKVKKIVKE